MVKYCKTSLTGDLRGDAVTAHVLLEQWHPKAPSAEHSPLWPSGKADLNVLINKHHTTLHCILGWDGFKHPPLKIQACFGELLMGSMSSLDSEGAALKQPELSSELRSIRFCSSAMIKSNR